MTFFFSKLFWIVFRPINAIILLLVVGLLMRRCNRPAFLLNTGRGFTILAAFLFFVLGFTNFPDYLLYRLEKIHVAGNLPDNPAGIIVLGGGLNSRIASLHDDGYALEGGADRLIAGFELSNRFPDIPLVYSGGASPLERGAAPEADVAQRVAKALYGNSRRFVLERRSRNTWENAVFSRQLLKPKNDETWIIVTSAFHALRAHGCFRKAGFNAVLWPTDYQSEFDGSFTLSYKSADQFKKAETALKEFIGIAAYSWMGRMDWPFGKWPNLSRD